MLPSESVFATVVSNLGIQISKKNKPVETNADFPDLGLRSYLFGADNSLSEEISPYDEVPGKIQVNLIEDDFSCNYVYVKISDNSFYFIGPYLSSIVSPIEIKKKLEVKGLKNIDYNYLSSYYHSLPVIRDQNLMQAIIQAHCVIRFGADNYNLVSIKLHLTTFQDNTEKKKLYSEYHMEKQSEIYAREELLMKAISEGNYNQAMNAMKRLETHNPEYRSSNTLRDYKNYLVILNTVCRISARNGGVPAYYIDSYSGRIARKIENSPSLKEMKNMNIYIITEYCNLVKNFVNHKYSNSIRQVTDYLDSNFQDDISLSMVADLFNMSEPHLSSRFHHETGKTFSEYINEKRISYAKTLLEKTSMSISSIAEDCGIQDNNYFSRIFKKTTGMSPLEYRKKNRQ